MMWSWTRWVGGGVLGGLLLAGGAFGEGEIQSPVRGIKLRDFSKGAIEAPVKNVVKVSQPQATISRSSTRVGSGAGSNPKVAPGKVHWHVDFAAACAASKKTGRPVLLFQMMGKLDERFC